MKPLVEKSGFRALEIPPRFRIVTEPPSAPDDRTIVVAPGRAFGDGYHETTQLCIQAIGALAPRGREWHCLDYGSGSGILSIAAAKLGAFAEGVDIDEDANRSATKNAHLSGVAHRATFGLTAERAAFDLVVANILRGVLLDLADVIAARVAPSGTLILSGLVGTDTPAVIGRYAALLGARPEIYERGDWRALVWRSRL